MTDLVNAKLIQPNCGITPIANINCLNFSLVKRKFTFFSMIINDKTTENG